MVGVGSLDVLRILSEATTVIAEGEVMQLLCTGKLELREEQYINVVRSKTAILMSAACAVGAILGAAKQNEQKALTEFGMDLGIAFQLMDDILDYVATEEEFGKSIGHDLEEGKITLPLIHTLAYCNDSEREIISAVVEQDEMSLDDFRAVSAIVKQYGGINYTTESARFYINRCKNSLNVFPPSPVREALADLAEYVITRSK
jgi:octaprenyl-diphosphate synthase